MMLPSFKYHESLRRALYIYLLKLKTNQTLEQIAPHFNKSIKTIGIWIRNIRKLVYEAFVPLHLCNRSRAELLKNTTSLSRKIYGLDKGKVVLTIDGTYVYTIKSSNFEFQKKSFSGQFKRNLIKFMLFVSTNELIAAAYGPFEAGKNDATILSEILNDPQSIFRNLVRGDVVVIDRGFKEVIPALRKRKLIVKVPKGTKKQTDQK